MAKPMKKKKYEEFKRLVKKLERTFKPQDEIDLLAEIFSLFIRRNRKKYVQEEYDVLFNLKKRCENIEFRAFVRCLLRLMFPFIKTMMGDNEEEEDDE